jgi:general secretion pathway protein K
MRRRANHARIGERGAALLMTLLLVAALAAVASSMSDGLRLAARRAANAEARDQALWHARGAETLALQVLRRDFEESPDVTTLEAAWARGPAVFDTDDGRIEAVIADRSNCFNLNSLATPAGERGRVADPAAVAELAALIVALGGAPADARRFAAAAADWIDRDESPLGGGAEDFDYAGLEPPYRTANAPFVEVEEVRALFGVDELMFRALRPYLCAYPDPAPAVLNVNTLKAEDAALLATALGGVLDVEAAADAIAARPAAGWGSLDEFWSVEVVRAVAIPEAARHRVAVTSRYFALDARVFHRDAYVEATSFLHRSGPTVRVLWRRLGGAG